MSDETMGLRKRLDIWAEEGGVMLKLTQPAPHRIAVEIIHPHASDPSKDKVLSTASLATFRWQRVADYFDTTLRHALQQAHAERDALAAALTRIYQSGYDPHVEIAREALTRMGETEVTT